MPGFYNNRTGEYVSEKCYDEGDWFEDTEGFLYIVPVGDDAETIGPDNKTEDWLNEHYREYSEEPTEDELADHGLVTIHAVFRRFNSIDGYYHA